MFFALIFTLKEKRQHKSEKEFENEVKRKSAVTFVTALFFLVAGSIELSNLDGISDRSRQDLIWEGLGEIVIVENNNRT
jgi:hypothetical protein